MSRTYNSKNRNAQAAKTRNRILHAAKELFQSKGFDGVTIDQLAKAASVSSPTIYSLFKSKRGVMRAFLDEALAPSAFEALVEKAQKEKSPVNRLRISAQMTRSIYDAERTQMDLFRSASVLGPELKALEKEREERRYERQKETIQAMVEESSLKKGLTEEKARAILWAFTGRDMYRMFVVDRSWKSKEYESWLAELLTSSLLD